MTSDRPENNALTPASFGWIAKVTTMAQDGISRARQALTSAAGSRPGPVTIPVNTGADLAANSQSARSASAGGWQPKSRHRDGFIDVRNEDEHRMKELFRAFLALNGGRDRTPEEIDKIDSMCREINSQIDKIIDPTLSDNVAMSFEELLRPRTGLENLQLYEKVTEFFRKESDISIVRWPNEIQAIQELRDNIDALMAAAGFGARATPMPPTPVSEQASESTLVEEEQGKLWGDLQAKTGTLISELEDPSAAQREPKRTSGFRAVFEELIQRRLSDLRNRGLSEIGALEIEKSATHRMERLILKISKIEFRKIPLKSPLRNEYHKEIKRLEALLSLEGNRAEVV